MDREGPGGAAVQGPAGGGGYFRLLPLGWMRKALEQLRSLPGAAMLYFHPWEFDPDQQRLPLGRLNSFRTYVGIGSSRRRLQQLLAGRRFSRLSPARACPWYWRPAWN